MVVWMRFGRASAALLIAAAFTGTVRAEECLPDWGEAGEIVRRQKLVTVQQLLSSAQQTFKGQIMKTTLCKDGDDYIYKVVVRQANGQFRTVVVDARNPLSGAVESAIDR